MSLRQLLSVFVVRQGLRIRSGQEWTVKKIVGREWRTCTGGERQVFYKINWGDKWQDTWESEEMVRLQMPPVISLPMKLPQSRPWRGKKSRNNYS